MKKLVVLASILVVCALAIAVYAQGGAGLIQGVVADPSGAIIPAADVVLMSADSAKVAETKSDDRGKFSFTVPVPGRYSVRVASPGFSDAAVPVTVAAGQTARLTVVLTVGSVTERVEVTAAPSVLQTESSDSTSRNRLRQLRVSVGNAPFRKWLAEDTGITEQYGLIDENRFQAVEQTPLSTFAADVDTASYSNVRRFLKEGNLPPKDAVRIEELINYFRYEGQDPDGEHPVRIDAETARTPWNDATRLVRISVRTKAIDMAELPPINLTFLIDVSGSMQSADKLPLLKRSLALLAEQLRPQDRVAITVYAGAAGVVLPPTSGSERAKILGVLERLEAGGSTAGAAGIQLAYATARESFRHKGINRVILATDGDFNVGISSDSELVRMIEQERESGIFLSVLGFGTGNLKTPRWNSWPTKATAPTPTSTTCLRPAGP